MCELLKIGILTALAGGISLLSLPAFCRWSRSKSPVWPDDPPWLAGRTIS